MGWASGSEVLQEILDSATFQQLSRAKRVALYMDLIQIFENHDCDTISELYGNGDEAFDAAYAALYPAEAKEMDEDLYPHVDEDVDEDDLEEE